MATFNLTFGQPVRFVALKWREDWVFDHPSVLLEPVVQYSPNGQSCEEMIEDGVEDIILDSEEGKAIEDEDVSVEFAWRGWSIPCLQQVAVKYFAGLDIDKQSKAVEKWFVFTKDEDGTVEATEVDIMFVLCN